MQEGAGAAPAAPVPYTRASLNELDVYNARSIKLAEATRVRLFLPGLKGGVMDEWDDPQDARVAAQAAAQAASAARGPSDTALKSRKKLAKVAALAHANDPAGGGAAAGGGGGGEGDPGGGMMMVVEAIMVLEDDEDDDGLLLLAPNGAGGAAGGAGQAAEGPGYAGGPAAVGPGGQQRLSQGYDGDRSSARSGTGGGSGSGRQSSTTAPGSTTASAGGGVSGRGGGAVSAGGGGGGSSRGRPGSATSGGGGGGRPASASASARRGGDGHGSSAGGEGGGGGGGSQPRLRTGPVSGSAGGADAAAAAPRVPVWARLTTNAPPAREKITPPPPKVYRAVQGKTLSLGLGGPDEGSGLFMVADPAAPYYGIEPGNGSGAAAAVAAAAAAALNGGRMGWPVIPPVPAMMRPNGTVAGGAPTTTAAAAAAVAAAGRVNGASLYGMPYDGDYGSSAGGAGRRAPSDGAGGPTGQLYANSAMAAVGPNVAFVRSRRLGNSASPSKGPSPSPPPPPAAATASPPQPLNGSYAAAADANGGGLGAFATPAASAAAAAAAATAAVGSPALRLTAAQRVQQLTRVASEVVSPGYGSAALLKTHSSELLGENGLRAAPSPGAAGWGANSPSGWSGSPGPPHGQPPGRLGQPSPSQQQQQQQQAGVPTAWPDPGGGAGGGGMSYNAMRAISYGSLGAHGQLSPGRASGGGASPGAMRSNLLGSPAAAAAAAAVAVSNGSGGGGLGAHANAPRSAPPTYQPYSPAPPPPPPAQPFSMSQQQPTYHHIAGPGPSSGYSGGYPQSDGYGNYGGAGGASRHVATPIPGGGRAGPGAGPSTLYGRVSVGNVGPAGSGGLLFGSGSNPHVNTATLAAVAAAAGNVVAGAGAVGGGGGGYDSSVALISRLRSSSFTQIAPQGR